MINHPGEQSSLNRFIEKADGYGYIDRATFDAQLEKLTDEAGKEYLTNLTKNWFNSEKEAVVAEDDFGDDMSYEDSQAVYDEEGNLVQ